MLQKGALERVSRPDPGFYSCLFLVEKATGRRYPVIDLSTLNGFVTLTKFQMESVAWVLGSIWIVTGCSPSTSKTPSRSPSIWTLVSIYCLFLRVRSSSCRLCALVCPQLLKVFTRVFSLISEWVHQRGVCPLWCLDDWLIVARVFAASPSSLRSSAPVVPGSGHCDKLGKVRPSAVHSDAISRYGDGQLSGEGVSFRGSNVSFLGLSCRVSGPSFSCEDAAAAIGSHGLPGAFSSQGSLSYVSSSMATHRPLVSHDGCSISPGPSVAGVSEAVRW